MNNDPFKRFLRAYLACALETATDEDGDDLAGSYIIEHYAEEAMLEAEKDCKLFLGQSSPLGSGTVFDLIPGGEGLEQAGYDLWLTRNGHGVGFWDRPELYGEAEAKALSGLAETFSTKRVYVGDDQKLYFE